jgi:hypothetical protein
MTRLTFEQLIEGEVYCRSIINEPIDFVVDFAVKNESALDRARRRWHHAEVIDGDHHERI